MKWNVKLLYWPARTDSEEPSMRKGLVFLTMIALVLSSSTLWAQDTGKLPTIVAKVNGKEISGKALEEATKLAMVQLQMMGQQVPASGVRSLQRGVLDDLIGMELLAQEAEKRKIKAPDDQVSTELQNFKSRFPNDESFNQALAEQGISQKELEDDLRAQLAISLLLKQEVEAKIQISNDEVTAFYNERKAQFKEPEKAKASHILVKVESGADQATRDAAKKKAEQLAKRAKSGEDFAKLASENSDDTGSAKNGGDLGEFQRSDMVKPFADAAFALEAGQVSGVVETRFGYHVIKLEKKSAAQTLTLDKVRGDIEQYLKLAKSQDEMRQYVEKLRSTATVQTFL